MFFLLMCSLSYNYFAVRYSNKEFFNKFKVALYHGTYALFFMKHSAFLGQPQHAYDFSNLSLVLCLQYAENNRICLQGYGLIASKEGPTRIQYSTKLETTIQWCSLRYNLALKSYPNENVHTNYRLLFGKSNGTF